MLCQRTIGERVKKTGWRWRAIGTVLITVLFLYLGVWSGASKEVQRPPELEQTLVQITQGGPFPYRQDGSVFQNREKRLPLKPNGYYREYTVPTPGISGRGPRRVVVGGHPPEIFYYTEDHYQTFRKLDKPSPAAFQNG